jgi:O-antigen/teichoic acid export membrane protein
LKYTAIKASLVVLVNVSDEKAAEPVENNFRKQFVRNLSWQALTVLTRAMISIITISILAHLAGPGTMGTFGLAWIGPTIAFALMQSGVSQGLIVLDEMRPGHLAAATWLTILVAIVMAGIIAAVAPLVETIYQIPGLAMATIWAAAVVPLMPLGVVDLARAQRELNFRLIAKVQTGAIFLTAITSIGLAYFWDPLAGLISFQGFLGVAQFVLFRIGGIKMQPLKTSITDLHDIWNSGKHFILVSLTASIMINIPQTVLGFFVTQTELGYFNLGRRLIEIINNQIGGIANQVIFPSIAKIRNEKETVAEIYLQTSRLTAALMVTVLLFLAARPTDFIVVYAGSDWAAAGQTFLFLLIFQGGMSLGQNMFAVFQAVGKASLVWKWNLSFGILQTTAILVFGNGNVEDAARAMAVASISVTFAAYLLSKTIGFDFKIWLLNMGRIILPAAVTLTVTILVGNLELVELGPVFAIMGYGAITALIYAVTISLTDPLIRRFLFQKFRSNDPK